MQAGRGLLGGGGWEQGKQGSVFWPACVAAKHTPPASDGLRQRVSDAGNRKPSASPEAGGGDCMSGPATDLKSTSDFEKIVNEPGAKPGV